MPIQSHKSLKERMKSFSAIKRKLEFYVPDLMLWEETDIYTELTARFNANELVGLGYIYGTGYSLIRALSLAMSTDAKKIVLIGCDFNSTHANFMYQKSDKEAQLLKAHKSNTDPNSVKKVKIEDFVYCVSKILEENGRALRIFDPAKINPVARKIGRWEGLGRTW